MTFDPDTLIHGYLDDQLGAEEQAQLATWLKESPEHARRFARTVFLHDRLRGELIARAEIDGRGDQPLAAAPDTRSRRWLRPWTAVTGLAAAAALVLLALWSGLGESPAAAAVELNRLIAVSSESADRTYQITVEEVALAPPPEDHSPSRPAKPPMDGAILHVRGENQFVLVRRTNEGTLFVTGCDGATSWAVRRDGPVRISSDLTRFSRDVPGHEHEMSLSNIHHGLERLRAAYDVQLLPIEEADDEAHRLLVAVKKRGYRGPRRVEITYAVASGQIRQLRFIEMPYGPDRLTLRLTLSAERPLGADFFHHEAHHDSDRVIAEE